MPLQAKANGLRLSQVPAELSNLNALELRLICVRLPFMKMVALPSGKQRSIHGPAVNVPSKVNTICDVLPRLPSQTDLVPLKLKRNVSYRMHDMYDYITPEKLLDALKFLKANNPLYSDIEINDEWLEEAIVNDAELSMSLVKPNDEQVENDDHTEHTENEQMETSNTCDVLSVARHNLEGVVCQNGFTIHELPADAIVCLVP